MYFIPTYPQAFGRFGRNGECLRWRAVEFEQNTLAISAGYSKPKGGRGKSPKLARSLEQGDEEACFVRGSAAGWLWR